jgi:hypothetical protein
MVAFDSEHVLHLKYNFVMNFNHRALVARCVIPLLLFLAAAAAAAAGLNLLCRVLPHLV